MRLVVLINLLYNIEDIAFNSHTDGGKLKYSTPSIMAIHKQPYEAFGTIDKVTYDLTLLDYDTHFLQLKSLKCGNGVNPAKCRITISRQYTPILYYLSPPVIYSGSQFAFWVDPRDA